MKSVAIIGGGITGLTAAFRLRQQNIPVALYEAGRRVGGVIQSFRQDGYLAESGPNTILETSPKIGALIADLGLEARRLYSDPGAEKRFLVRRGKPVALPSSPGAFLASPLFSTSAKWRLLVEPFIRRAPADREETVAQFVLRRLGQEFLDYAINPLVAGVYAGDPARLSVPHAFPKLHALEQRYGSLILGQILGARERKRRAEVSKQTAKKVSFDEGLQVLIDTLETRLGDSIQLGSKMTRLERASGAWELGIERDGVAGRHMHTAVLFAGTTSTLSELRWPPELGIDPAPLADVHYPPVTSVVLGFKRNEVAHPLDGFGVLIPQVEGYKILGTLFSSSFFPNRAPAGHVTLTSYIGGARYPELASLEPPALVELTCRDLERLLGVSGKPTFIHQTFFRRAIPQYEVGYGRCLKLMDEIEAKAPGVFLAGHYRNGISLSDSIVAGHDVAGRLAGFVAGMPAGEKGHAPPPHAPAFA